MHAGAAGCSRDVAAREQRLDDPLLDLRGQLGRACHQSLTAVAVLPVSRS